MSVMLQAIGALLSLLSARSGRLAPLLFWPHATSKFKAGRARSDSASIVRQSVELLFSEQIPEEVARVPTDRCGAVGDSDAKYIVQLSEALCSSPIDRKRHVVAWLMVMVAHETSAQFAHIFVLVKRFGPRIQVDARHALAYEVEVIGAGKESPARAPGPEPTLARVPPPPWP